MEKSYLYKNKSGSTIWIAWEEHRRTIELCEFINIQPTFLLSNLPRIIKHLYLIFRSYLLMRKRKPKTLIVQNPSIALTLLACALHSRFKYKLVVDAHNAGLIPESRLLKKIQTLHKYLQREADTTVVTNEALAEIVEKNNGKPFVLPDKLPKPPTVKRIKLRSKYNVVYICTFGLDEPYKEVLIGGKNLPNEITIYITGDYKRVPSQIIDKAPKKIVFKGYLSEMDYWNLLYSADLVMDLTLRENCLVCGAYEAISVGTPLILSDTKVLKEYFYKGAVFTPNRSEDINKNILIAIKNLKRLRSDIRYLKKELDENWLVRGKNFKKTIGL